MKWKYKMNAFKYFNVDINKLLQTLNHLQSHISTYNKRKMKILCITLKEYHLIYQKDQIIKRLLKHKEVFLIFSILYRLIFNKN